MIFLSTIIACLLIGGGAGAMFMGAGMIILERGWSMVIAGSVIATGGVLLLGLVMVLRELRRLPDQIATAMSEFSVALEEGAEVAREPVLSKDIPDLDHEPRLATEMRFEKEADSTRRPKFDVVLPTFNDGGHKIYGTKAGGGAAKVAEMAEVRTGASGAAIETPILTSNDHSDNDLAQAQQQEEKLREEKRTDNEVDGTHGDLFATREQEQSTLKIQVSLHGQPVSESSSDTFSSTYVVENNYEKQQSKSIWPKIGRGRKTSALPSELPPGPTAADRARERLALADTPIDKSEEENLLAMPEPAPESGSDQIEKNIAGDGGPENAGENGAPLPASAKAEIHIAHAQEGGASREALTEKLEAPSVEDIQRQIVGSYKAGSNVYIMYDDGTIEAETPQGVFRFDTLDSLKDYIASGENPAFAGLRVERGPASKQ